MTAELIELPFVPAEGGGIVKIIRKSSEQFSGFGELYLSQLSHGVFRGWKMHREMHSIIFVVTGAVSFHFFGDDSPCYSLDLREAAESHVGLRIPAGTNFGFKSTSSTGAVVANLASVEFSSDEVFRPEMTEHECGWAR